MLLTEAEGKTLLANQNLYIPQGVLIEESQWLSGNNEKKTALASLEFPVYVKAQVLHGNRALQGLVKKAEYLEEAIAIMEQFFAHLSETKSDGTSQATQVLIEEAADIEDIVYLSITYDTRTRQPLIQFSRDGGEGMDERMDKVEKIPVSLTQPLSSFAPEPTLTATVNQLLQVFATNDATLVEVNPLARTVDDRWICLDAKIELENVARFRHPEWEVYGERSSLGRPWTSRELKAHEVSHLDHRGVAGESFFEFPGGEIGVMASGGGASTLAMDALLAVGLKPANYTEYSGNPTGEKVRALAEVVLSLPELKGLYVVGSNASFTDIFETLSGLIDGLLDSPYADKPGFAVLIRRGGPRWEEAFEMVKTRLAGKPVKLKLFGPEYPLVKTAEDMRKLLES